MGRGGRAWIAAAALVAALAGAATARAGFTIEYPKGPDPAVREWPSWPDPVSCGTAPFDPASGFGGPTGAENGSGGPEMALRRFLDEGVDPAAPREYWRVVSASPTEVEFAQGRLAQGPFRVAFALVGGQWKPDGLASYCVPRSVRPGEEALRWRLVGRLPGPRSRRIRIDLQGSGGCDGGRDLNAAARPEFTSRGRRLALTVWATALPQGLYTCQRRVEPPLSVRLPGRLGGRRLFDGRTFPPRPAR